MTAYLLLQMQADLEFEARTDTQRNPVLKIEKKIKSLKKKRKKVKTGRNLVRIKRI